MVLPRKVLTLAIAQANQGGFHLVTHDAELARYPVAALQAAIDRFLNRAATLVSQLLFTLLKTGHAAHRPKPVQNQDCHLYAKDSSSKL